MTDPGSLARLVGTELGVTPWLEVDQRRLDDFSEAADNYQWIHDDDPRAWNGPYGAPVAHGYLTLAWAVAVTRRLGLPKQLPLVTDQGLERVRFPSPVRVGERIRARSELVGVTPLPEGVEVLRRVTVEIEGREAPAMVAETLSTCWL